MIAAGYFLYGHNLQHLFFLFLFRFFLFLFLENYSKFEVSFTASQY